MIDSTKPEIRFAVGIVRAAAQLTEQVRLRLGTASQTKQDRSPVTVADFAVQALVAKRLAETFPEDTLVGEEDSSILRSREEGGDVLRQATEILKNFIPEATPEGVCDWVDYGTKEARKRFWTLDPVDGTKGFLRGGQYVAALALIVDGKVELGVLGCPRLKEGRFLSEEGEGSLVISIRGQGTWWTPLKAQGDYSPLRVSARTDARTARVVGSVESAHTDLRQMEEWVRVLEIENHPLSIDSQAKHVLVASGACDLFMRPLIPSKPDYRMKIWDEAAGSLIIEEAGGKVTDLTGAKLDFSQGKTLARNSGLLATNGHLHEKALKAIQTITRNSIGRRNGEGIHSNSTIS